MRFDTPPVLAVATDAVDWRSHVALRAAPATARGGRPGAAATPLCVAVRRDAIAAYSPLVAAALQHPSRGPGRRVIVELPCSARRALPFLWAYITPPDNEEEEEEVEEEEETEEEGRPKEAGGDGAAKTKDIPLPLPEEPSSGKAAIGVTKSEVDDDAESDGEEEAEVDGDTGLEISGEDGSDVCSARTDAGEDEAAAAAAAAPFAKRPLHLDRPLQRSPRATLDPHHARFVYEVLRESPAKFLRNVAALLRLAARLGIAELTDLCAAALADAVLTVAHCGFAAEFSKALLPLLPPRLHGLWAAFVPPTVATPNGSRPGNFLMSLKRVTPELLPIAVAACDPLWAPGGALRERAWRFTSGEGALLRARLEAAPTQTAILIDAHERFHDVREVRTILGCAEDITIAMPPREQRFVHTGGVRPSRSDDAEGDAEGAGTLLGLAAHLRRLRRLWLRELRSISLSALEPLARCPALTELVLERCPQISFATATSGASSTTVLTLLRRLTALRITNCDAAGALLTLLVAAEDSADKCALRELALGLQSEDGDAVLQPPHAAQLAVLNSLTSLELSDGARECGAVSVAFLEELAARCGNRLLSLTLSVAPEAGPSDCGSGEEEEVEEEEAWEEMGEEEKQEEEDAEVVLEAEEKQEEGEGKERIVSPPGSRVLKLVAGAFSGITRLELRLPGPKARTAVDPPAIAALAALQHLAELGLVATGFVDDALAEFENHKLRALRLNGLRLGHRSLTHIAAIPTLTSLDLARCAAIDSEQLEGLARGLPALTALSLADTAIVAAHLADLRYAPSLVALDLSGATCVTDAGMRALAGACAGLTTLTLGPAYSSSRLSYIGRDALRNGIPHCRIDAH